MKSFKHPLRSPWNFSHSLPEGAIINLNSKAIIFSGRQPLKTVYFITSLMPEPRIFIFLYRDPVICQGTNGTCISIIAWKKDRGLDFTEDLFNHGIFTVDLQEADVLYVVVSTENPAAKNPHTLFEQEKDRKRSLLKAVPGDLSRQLTLAADQFVVKRKIQIKASSPTSLDLKNSYRRLSLVYRLGKGYDDFPSGTLPDDRTI